MGLEYTSRDGALAGVQHVGVFEAVGLQTDTSKGIEYGHQQAAYISETVLREWRGSS